MCSTSVLQYYYSFEYSHGWTILSDRMAWSCIYILGHLNNTYTSVFPLLSPFSHFWNWTTQPAERCCHQISYYHCSNHVSCFKCPPAILTSASRQVYRMTRLSNWYPTMLCGKYKMMRSFTWPGLGLCHHSTFISCFPEKFFCLIIFILWSNISILMEMVSSWMTLPPSTEHEGSLRPKMR